MADFGKNRWAHPAVILVATDLSDLDRLMPFALEQASQSGARLILLNVIPGSGVRSAAALGMSYYDPGGALESAEKLLKPWCDGANRERIVCDTLVREGLPSQQIVAAARQFNADRILLGTRSRSKLGKMLLGSVAEQVLRSVNLPVITVGPEAHLPVQAAFAQRVVLHATSLRETSSPSAALAFQMAAELNAKLVLMHVLPPMIEMQGKGQLTGLDSPAMQELWKLAGEAGGNGCCSVEPVVVHGNPTIEILSEASERNASLIVLGSTNRSALENLTRDRTVYRVLACARCPVLTLREAPAIETDHLERVEAYYG